MTQIPNVITSVAQSQLTQKQRAAETDASREAQARGALAAQRKAADNREFVQDMAEATGLKVDADGKHESETRKKRRFLEMADPDEPRSAEPVSEDDEARSHAAALLADPDSSDGAPPPCMIDIEA